MSLCIRGKKKGEKKGKKKREKRKSVNFLNTMLLKTMNAVTNVGTKGEGEKKKKRRREGGE